MMELGNVSAEASYLFGFDQYKTLVSLQLVQGTLFGYFPLASLSLSLRQRLDVD